MGATSMSLPQTKKKKKKKKGRRLDLRARAAAAEPKPAVCLRLDASLKALIDADAESAERTTPAQIRLILKTHYEKASS